MDWAITANHVSFEKTSHEPEQRSALIAKNSDSLAKNQIDHQEYRPIQKRNLVRFPANLFSLAQSMQGSKGVQTQNACAEATAVATSENVQGNPHMPLTFREVNRTSKQAWRTFLTLKQASRNLQH